MPTTRWWVIPVFGCVQPDELDGPHVSRSKLLRAARRIFKDQKEGDGIFWLEIGADGIPHVGAFSNKEMGD